MNRQPPRTILHALRGSRDLFALLGLLALPAGFAGLAAGCSGGPGASAPRGGAAGDGPQPGGAAVIEWRREQPAGERVAIDAGGFWLGPADPAAGPRAHYLFAHHRRADELAQIARDFAPFRQAVAGGVLELRGHGTAPPDAAERRMIGEWSRQVAFEAAGDLGASPYGLALSWHRGAATEGACDDLEVYLSGEVRAGTCGGPGTVHGRLAGERLERFYAWVDQLRPLQDSGDAGDPRADALLERLVFAGRGTRQASRDEVAALQSYAATLHHELATSKAQPQPQPPAGPSPGVITRPAARADSPRPAAPPAAPPAARPSPRPAASPPL